MNIEDFEKIIKILEQCDLAEITLEEGNFKLHIKKTPDGPPPLMQNASPVFMPPNMMTAMTMNTPSMLPSEHGSTQHAEKKEEGVCFITSPMVGTFYRAPSPDRAPFVDIGSHVNGKTVVCILEAMKVMNEIPAEVDGTVVEILVKDSQPVEFGQPLFKIKVK